MSMQGLRDLLHEEAFATVAARVALHDNETTHWRLADEGHVLLDVRTLQHDVPVRAILRGGGNDGTGAWFIPSLGTEVMLTCDIDFEGDVFVSSIHGLAPDGLAENLLLLLGQAIELRAADGTAEALAKQASVTALENKLNDHINLYNTHVHPGVTLGPDPTPVTASADTPIASSQGTEVVKGQ